MHPLFLSGKKIFITGLLWSPVTFWVVMLHMLLTASPITDSAIFVIPPMIIELFIAASLWYICKATPFSDKDIITFFTKHTLSMATVTSLLLLVTFGYSLLLSNLYSSDKWNLLFHKSLFLFAGTGISIYILVSLLFYLIISNEKVLDAEKKYLNQQLETTRAELNAIKNTIHPHFIFNSLNLMKPLIKKDPLKAGEVISQLSEFLIYSYVYGSRSESTVEKELEHVRNYLHVEKMRLGKRLNIDYSIDKRVLNYSIIPLSLLPLAENSIKHGISQLLDGGTIRIIVKKEKTSLVLEFINPFEDSYKESNSRSGYGLTNLEKRVKLFYGNSAGIITSKKDYTFSVKLFIPLKTGAENE